MDSAPDPLPDVDLPRGLDELHVTPALGAGEYALADALQGLEAAYVAMADAARDAVRYHDERLGSEEYATECKDVGDAHGYDAATQHAITMAALAREVTGKADDALRAAIARAQSAGMADCEIADAVPGLSRRRIRQIHSRTH
ncbi:hypothetical protein [Frankia sp. Cj3]|uniref:hypothetical protein n=1 Tax=Frankia sp. Cj3 TaxID=2880976 RepID=UPI001EF4DB4F|nr:hypothetical protein [Frankia sp. Cj3]